MNDGDDPIRETIPSRSGPGLFKVVPQSNNGELGEATGGQQAGRALLEGEARFRALGDSIPQLVWAAHADGFIHWYNRRWYEYTGTTPEQMEGWGWQSVHDPVVLPAVLEKWRAAIASGQPFEMEFPLRGADGNFRIFLTRVLPQRDDAGRVIQWFGTNTDIQHRIESEKMLRESTEVLRAARDAAEDASRAKDRFLATLSHELRTPLTPVLMLALAMEGDERLPPDIRADFAMISKNIAIEARIIDDLLDLTRISHGKLALRMETVDPRPILEHTLNLLQNQIAEKSLDVSFDGDCAGVYLTGDSVRLQQIFWNLLNNAVKFTPSGGKITVRFSKSENHLHFEFSDSGLGILPEEMPRIFDAFAQGKEAASPRFGGLGLGLSISSILVREHGGRLWAESPGPGQGSTFHVELPRGEGAPPLHTASRPVPDRPRSLHILLVEDHQASRETLARLLTRRGHVVKGADCIAKAREFAGQQRFDVVVSDLGLPDGAGHELMRLLRRDFNLPGIALSGYGMGADLDRSQDSGFSEHLTKPVSLTALEEALARVVAAGLG